MFASPFGNTIGFYNVSLTARCSSATLLPLLHREERELLQRTKSPISPTAFCMGRLAAHAALAQIEIENAEPILENENGVLVWPKGIIGTISYSDTQAVAAVAHCEDALSLGVCIKPLRKTAGRVTPVADGDVEDPMTTSMWNREKTYAKLLCLYSAKESVVNALSPLCGTYISILDILLRWDNGLGRFRGVLQRTLNSRLPAGMPLEVGCDKKQGYVMAHVSL